MDFVNFVGSRTIDALSDCDKYSAWEISIPVAWRSVKYAVFEVFVVSCHFDDRKELPSNRVRYLDVETMEKLKLDSVRVGDVISTYGFMVS